MSTIVQRQQLVDDLESTLARDFVDVEVLDVEVQGGRSAAMTVYIDRPGGVDLALCEAVTHALDGLRAEHALSVSSPGLDRPLRTRLHFEQALDRRVFVKSAEQRDGRAVFRGRLAKADADEVTLALDEGGEARIPYTAIAKAHVIFEFDDDGGQP